MMSAVVIALAINCAEPRLSFEQFYSQYFYGSSRGHWSGDSWEDRTMVTKRVLNAVANYTDYAIQYREKCK